VTIFWLFVERLFERRSGRRARRKWNPSSPKTSNLHPGTTRRTEGNFVYASGWFHFIVGGENGTVRRSKLPNPTEVDPFTCLIATHTTSASSISQFSASSQYYRQKKVRRDVMRWVVGTGPLIRRSETPTRNSQSGPLFGGSALTRFIVHGSGCGSRSFLKYRTLWRIRFPGKAWNFCLLRPNGSILSKPYLRLSIEAVCRHQPVVFQR